MTEDSPGPRPPRGPGAPRRFFFDDLADDPDAPPIGSDEPAPPPVARPAARRPVPGPPVPARGPDPSDRPDRRPRRIVFDDLAGREGPTAPAGDEDDTLGADRPRPPVPGTDADSSVRPSASSASSSSPWWSSP